MKKKEREIYESLLEQLKKKSADISAFKDQVNDYMSMWNIKEDLIKDIRKRGISFPCEAASGKATIVKQNPSIKELLMVNKQMLMVLEKLGLTVKETVSEDDVGEL